MTLEEAVQAFLRLGVCDADRLSLTELSAIRRGLALKYHPDRSGGDVEKFQRMNLAYQVLAKALRKARHVLPEKQRQKPGP